MADAGFILKVRLAEFAKGLDVRYKKMSRGEGDTKALGPIKSSPFLRWGIQD